MPKQTKLKNLINKYIDTEQLIRYELGEMPCAGAECKCKYEESVFIIDHGPHFPEVHEYCIKCGGFRNP